MATVYRKAINPGPYRNMQYDPVRDFAPIAQVGVTPTLLGVHPSVLATDVKSLVALVKDNAGKFTYGSSRPPSTPPLPAAEVQALSRAPHIVYPTHHAAAPLWSAFCAADLP